MLTTPISSSPPEAASAIVPRVMLLAAVATSGLSAGFMFLWNAVMIPGLAIVDDVAYIQAMNGVNSVIRNAPFAIAFFGSFIAMVVTLLLASRMRRLTTGFLLAALGLYAFVLVVTFTVHVPMNRDLLELTDLTGLDTAEIRSTYETRWNLWHRPRAWATLLSFLALVAATASEGGLLASSKGAKS